MIVNLKLHRFAIFLIRMFYFVERGIGNQKQQTQREQNETNK